MAKEKEKEKEKAEKICFVIAPIGPEGSEIRERSDEVLDYIIRPPAEDCGYTVVRADKIDKPGMITTDVIQHILNDPLVVADLTGHNPNVFYELALRHAINAPVVQIIESGGAIPFDVSQNRTIQFSRGLRGADVAKKRIASQIRAVEKNPKDVDSPISQAIQLNSLRTSENPLEKSNAEIISMLHEIRSMLISGTSRIELRSQPIKNQFIYHDVDTFDALMQRLGSIPPDRLPRELVILLHKGRYTPDEVKEIVEMGEAWLARYDPSSLES